MKEYAPLYPHRDKNGSIHHLDEKPQKNRRHAPKSNHDPQRRALLKGALALGSAALAKKILSPQEEPVLPEYTKEDTAQSPEMPSAQQTTAEKEPPAPATLRERIYAGDTISAEDGPALAHAAYTAQQEHLQTYTQRNERNDFTAAQDRIIENNPARLIAPFAQRNLPPEIALGLPVQESFFTPRAMSHSKALGTHQIKLPVALSILRQDKMLTQKYAKIVHKLSEKEHASAAKKEVFTKLLTDPSFSADISAAILDAEYQKYPDIDLAITAYNTGRMLAGARKIMREKNMPFTYENFTKVMAKHIGEIADKIRKRESFYTIRPGDTFFALHNKFPHYSKGELLKLIGNSTQLRAGARTKIPITDKKSIAQKIITEAHKYIEPLEYAAKVRASSDLLIQNNSIAHTINTSTQIAQK